jgi:tRNA threonylcarbamoyladenosine biosynthesis protein TsaB
MTIFDCDYSFSCLSIETSTPLSSVSVCFEGRCHSMQLSGNRPGAGQVYAAIHEVLGAVSASPRDLDFIAFGCGPGSFTGVRIASAVTQGLAFGLQIPVFRYSSLGLLAAGSALHMKADLADKVFAAAFDARQNEAYIGFYRMRAGELESIVPDALVKPKEFKLGDIASALNIRDLILTGPGWELYPSLQLGAEPIITAYDFDRLPHSFDLFFLAVQAQREGELTDAFSAQPNYLRDKVTD